MEEAIKVDFVCPESARKKESASVAGSVASTRMMDEEDAPQYEKLISLSIGEARVQVPENNSLLRCFEYLSWYQISMGGFCWNADCRTCEVVVRTGSEPPQRVLSCQTVVVPGMMVLEMTEKLRFCLRDLVRKSETGKPL